MSDVRELVCSDIKLNVYGDDEGNTIFGDLADVTFGDPWIERPLRLYRVDPDGFRVGWTYYVPVARQKVEHFTDGRLGLTYWQESISGTVEPADCEQTSIRTESEGEKL